MCALLSFYMRRRRRRWRLHQCKKTRETLTTWYVCFSAGFPKRETAVAQDHFQAKSSLISGRIIYTTYLNSLD